MYTARLVADLVNTKNSDISEWESLAVFLGYVTPDSDPANIAHEWVVCSATEGDNDDQVEEEKEGDGLLTANSFLPTVPRSFLTLLPSVSSMDDDKMPTSGIHAKSHHVQHQ